MPAGRPPTGKYKIKEMIQAIDKYLEEKKREQEEGSGGLPVVKELCLNQGWSYDSIMRMQRTNDELRQSLKKVTDAQEAFIVKYGTYGKLNPAMSIFMLSQPVHGYINAKNNNVSQEATANESVGYTGLPACVMGSQWVDVNRDIDDRKHNQYDFKGGRGSLKSSYCGLKLVDLIMTNDDFCALAVKQHFNEIKDTTYAQVVWAIDELGLTEQFRCIKSPFEIRRKSTGQIIYFRAGEDPGKLKSVKPPRGMHVGVVWIEEADQIKGEDALRNIKQSAFRGGDDGLLFRSYNTPISAQHYINKQELVNNPQRLIHHSHFRKAPPEWLGKRFYDDAELLKSTNERAYRHEYDGEATGTGANVFENVALREITDDEIKQFDSRYEGVDFGYYPDPWAYIDCYYDASRRRLFIFDEACEYKKNNRQTADILLNDKGLAYDDELICDSVEPKSIADYVEFGLCARGAEKGPKSVMYSIKWLQGLAEIIIDPCRCPHAAEEFQTYEYEKTKDGEIISAYPDKNNHFIDATRYALNLVWRERGI